MFTVCNINVEFTRDVKNCMVNSFSQEGVRMSRRIKLWLLSLTQAHGWTTVYTAHPRSSKVTAQVLKITSWVLLSRQVLFHVRLVPVIPRPVSEHKTTFTTTTKNQQSKFISSMHITLGKQHTKCRSAHLTNQKRLTRTLFMSLSALFSGGVYIFWWLARSLLVRINSWTSRLPFSTNLEVTEKKIMRMK